MANREFGTGSIYQRENGTWVGRIRTADATGKLKSKYFSGKTEAEVKKKIREFNKSTATVDQKKISVEQYLRNWLVTFKQETIKKSSYDRLENTAIHQIIPAIGSLHLSQVTTDDIQKLINDLKKSGLSYSTVKKVYDCLNEMFLHATIKSDIVRNPMLLVNMPKQSLFDKKDIRYFSEKEMALITEECRREYSTGKNVYPYGEAFILTMHTGLRMGELIGLKKSDWDKQNEVLHIRRNAQPVKRRNEDGERTEGREIVFNTTKTYSGERDIPLNASATEALERLTGASKFSEFIVCTSNGGMVPPDRIERSFYRMLTNIGIEKTGMHSLRHTFASVLFANKVDIKTVSYLLGHASIQITLNTYVHLINGVDKTAVETLDKI